MIEVILREDIKTLGKAGEMVRVKPGYARNYLLPHGLAYEATEGNKKRIAAETRARGIRNAAEKTEAEKAAADKKAQIEDAIQNARRYYNAVVRDLNTRIQQFPSNLIAGMFGFTNREFFEIPDADRAVPQVKF